MLISLRKGLPPRIETARLLLREVGLSDLSDDLIWWLNDPDINQFLEVRHAQQTAELIKSYILAKLSDLSNPHFGVYTQDRQLLIGTVTINLFNPHHNTADISFVIGHPKARGKGYATEAVHAVCAYMISVVKLHKITGGLYATNIASKKVFEKNKFVLEGVRRKHCMTREGVYVDALLYGLLENEFIPDFHLLGGESITVQGY